MTNRHTLFSDLSDTELAEAIAAVRSGQGIFQQIIARENAARADRIRRDAIAADRVERQRIQREIAERMDRERRDRELVGLRIKSAQQSAWQRNVDQAAHNAVAYKQNLTLMSELDKMINPAPPPPEPTVVVVEQDDGSSGFGQSEFRHSGVEQ